MRGWKWGSEAEPQMERRPVREVVKGGGGVYLGRVFVGVDLAILSNEVMIIAW